MLAVAVLTTRIPGRRVATAAAGRALFTKCRSRTTSLSGTVQPQHGPRRCGSFLTPQQLNQMEAASQKLQESAVSTTNHQKLSTPDQASSDGLSSSSPPSSSTSSSEYAENSWKELWQQLRDSEQPWSDEHWIQAQEALRKCMAQRPVTTASAQQTLEVWNAMMQQRARDRTVSTSKGLTTEELNAVLRHWRMGLVQGEEGLVLPVNDASDSDSAPSEILPAIQSLLRQQQQHPQMVAAAANTETYQLLADVLIRCRPQDVEEVLKIVLPPTIDLFVAVIQRWATSGHYRAGEKAQQWLEKLRQVGLEPDERILKAVLQAWTTSAPHSSEAPVRAQQIFSEMASLDMRRDAACYQHLLQAWAASPHADGVDRANDFLQAMVQNYVTGQGEEGIVPTLSWFSTVATGYARRGQADKVQSILFQLQGLYEETGEAVFVPHVSLFDGILGAFAEAPVDCAPSAQGILNELKKGIPSGDTTIYPSRRSYLSVMKLWANSSSDPRVVEHVQALFDELQSHYEESGDEAYQPRGQAYSILLTAWTKSGRPESAERGLELLQSMSSSEEPPSYYHFSAVISAFAKTGNVEKAEELVQQMLEVIDPHISCYNALISAYGRSSLPDAGARAQSLFNDLKDGNVAVAPDLVTYMNVMQAWLHSGSQDAVDHVQALFDELQSRFESGDDKFQPSSKTYSVLLSAWAKSGRPESAKRAMDILHHMEQQHRLDHFNERPDIYHYAAVIRTFGRVGDVVGAEKLFQQMVLGKYVAPGIDCYNALAWAYSNSKVPDFQAKAESLLLELEQGIDTGGPTIYPDVVTYSTVMKMKARLCSPSDAADSVLELFGRLLARYKAGDKTCRPDGHVYSMLLTSRCRSGRHDASKRAIAVLRDMTKWYKRDQSNAKPDSSHFASVIGAVASKGDFFKAEKLFQAMETLNVEPSIACYNGLIEAYSLSTQRDGAKRAESVLRELQRQSRMDGVNIHPDVVTYLSVMKIWARSSAPDAVDRVQAIFDELEQTSLAGSKVRPNDPVLSVLLSAWINCGRPGATEKALAVLTEMEKKHLSDPSALRPNAYHYATLIAGFGRVGDVATAEKLLDHLMRLEGTEPNVFCFNSLIGAYGRSNLPNRGEKAEAILEKLEAGIQVGNAVISPDSDSYSNAMQAWLHSRAPNAAERIQALFDRMQRRFASGHEEARPDAKVYSVLLSAWARSRSKGSAQRALTILNEMEAMHQKDGSYPRPDSFHFAAVISAFAHGGNDVKAEELLKRFLNEKDAEPSISCYNAVLAAYASSRAQGAGVKAEKLLRRLQNGFKFGSTVIFADEVSYENAFRALEKPDKGRAFPRAYDIVHHMVGQYRVKHSDRRKPPPPTSKTFAALLRLLLLSDAVTNKAEVADEILSLMRSCKVKADDKVFRLVGKCRLSGSDG